MFESCSEHRFVCICILGIVSARSKCSWNKEYVKKLNVMIQHVACTVCMTISSGQLNYMNKVKNQLYSVNGDSWQVLGLSSWWAGFALFLVFLVNFCFVGSDMFPLSPNHSMNRLNSLPRGFGSLPALEVLDLTYNNLNEHSLPGNFFYLSEKLFIL